MTNRTIISPIAVDLGAKNTGVYMHQYESGATIKDLNNENKKAFTLCLENNNLTLMMANRTAARHQRRGYDRKQMAKRMARLVLINALDFDSDKHQEAISFLINRRGRILGDDIDENLFREIPRELAEIAVKHNKELEKIFGKTTEYGTDETIDIGDSINELMKDAYESDKGKKVLEDLCNIINEYNDNEAKKKILNKEIKNNKGETEEDIKSKKKIEKELKDVQKIIQEHKELEINIFNYKQTYKEEDTTPEEPEKTDKYYPYLVWQIYKVLQETITNIKTGHALRGTYLEHIKKDLDTYSGIKDIEELPKSIEHQLYELAEAVRSCSKLDTNSPKNRIEKFINLIGNISNMQLRGLRKYFNNKEHKEEDQWVPEKLDKVYERWLKSLRPRKEDRKRIQEIVDALKSKNEIAGSRAVSLWLTTNPAETIPPFEDQNNRRPPTCRSLVLKPYKLDERLAEWRNIVKTITAFYKEQDPEIYKTWQSITEKTIEGFGRQKIEYRQILKKRNSKKSEKELCWGIKKEQDAIDARSLQFLLDLSKSHQTESQIPILRSIIDPNDNTHLALSQKIKDENDGETWNSFKSFCKTYYQEIRYSMDGRWFDENPDNLLDICKEKPRNKTYQVAGDFGNLFNLNKEQVNDLTGGVRIEKWIKKIGGVKDHSEKCAKLQKNVGNDLEKYISLAWQKEDKERNDNEDYYLEIDKECKKLAKKIETQIKDDLKEKLQVDTIDHTKFNSVFTFAQIHNIVFADRSGNSKTCPCCSVDNQGRMSRLSKKDYALASRLRGYIARPIDGVATKLLEAKARLIAKEKIEQIKPISNKIQAIRIPIITEQNKFSFEENLGKYKGKKSKRLKKLANQRPEIEYKNKDLRIKEAGYYICPYTGKKLNDSNGEIDHIISRSKSKKSSQTVLNSEANLIYADPQANRDKDKMQYFIENNNLDQKYLNKQFGSSEHEAIKEKIERDLGIFSYSQDNPTREEISKIIEDSPVLKNFSSFVRLTTEQQRAFRHALFLKNGPARRVIESVLNRSDQAKVNGSQRYFASLIAKHLKEQCKEKRLSKIKITYDYFEVEAQEVHDIRHRDLAKIKQDVEKEVNQSTYSHAIDATLVFLTANNKSIVNRNLRANISSSNELGIVRDEDVNILSVNKQTGELISTKNYEAIEIEKHQHKKISVDRKKPDSSYYLHRDIHRSGSFYALKFIPLIICKDSKHPLRVGFSFSEDASKNHSAVLDNKSSSWISVLEVFLKFAEHKNNPIINKLVKNSSIESLDNISQNDYEEFIKKSQEYLKHKQKNYLYINIKAQKACEFLIENVNNSVDKMTDDTVKKARILIDLSYKTIKTKIIEHPYITSLLLDEDEKDNKKIKEKQNKLLKQSKNKRNEIDKKLKIKFLSKEIYLPALREWNILYDNILDRNTSNDPSKYITSKNIKDFLKKHSIFKEKNNKQTKRLHKRVRQVYSLPLVSGEGKFLQQRKSWNGKDSLIYQVINDADPRSGGGNTYQAPMLNQQNKIVGKLQQPYISKQTSYLQRLDKKSKPNEKSFPIRTNQWFDINDIPQDLQEIGIKTLSYRVDDVTSPSVRFTIDEKDISSWDKLDKLENSSFLKPRDNSKKKADEDYKKAIEAYHKAKEKYDKAGTKQNKEQGNPAPTMPKKEDFMQNRLEDVIDRITSNHVNKETMEVIWKAKSAGYNKELINLLALAIKEQQNN